MKQTKQVETNPAKSKAEEDAEDYEPQQHNDLDADGNTTSDNNNDHSQHSGSGTTGWYSWVWKNRKKEGTEGSSGSPPREVQSESDLPAKNQLAPYPNPGIKERTSWYSLFGKKSQQNSDEEQEEKENDKQDDEKDEVLRTGKNENDKNGKDEGDKKNGKDSSDKKSGTKTPDSTKTWAFWSKENKPNEGELAVAGEYSQDHPEHVKRAPEAEKSGSESEQQQSQTRPQEQKPAQKAPKKQKIIRPNIVGPSADECFPMYSQAERFRSSVKRISEYLAPSLKNLNQVHLHDPVYRTTPFEVKKVVVIGVHGFFPTRVVRSVLGQPRGTSLKFANEAAEAVERWAQRQEFEVEIEKIALEGEGKVLDRVEKLDKLLKNWIDHIHDADFIFFAAHSQGTPVAVHLLARLVEEGHVENNQQLALLGMAGVSLGPMSGLDQKFFMKAYSSIESDSLSELFQFQDLQSFQSRKYLDSLRTIIAHNCKIAFVGSLNDQLVPLYSSTCIHLTHPNIYRAVYVDGQDVPPEFISTLVTLALRLRNIGSSDHGVIKEISGALSGTLTGGGHSKIYDEQKVYDLALSFALETTQPSHSIPIKVASEFKVPKTNSNPFILPWCMRGLLSEALTRESLAGQLNELYDEFEQWKPETKVLKDMKYRLNAIQAKL